MSEENTHASSEGLYRVEVEDLTDARAPLLVHTLRGSLDAGGVGEQVARHLLESLPSRRVVTFDADELIDYRSRRPAMELENFRYSAYHEPQIAIDLLKDDEGQPLLLLHGAEPDLRWEAFVEDVTVLVERLGVTQSLGVHGFPAPVPHTRPTQVQTHGDEVAELEERRGIMLGTIQLPGSASSLLEYRLQEKGHRSTGLSVGVPHYLAQNEFPAAAAEAVRWISRAGGLALPVGDLEAEAAEVAAAIAEQVDKSPEIGAMVQQLEAQFDNYVEVAKNGGADSRTLPPSVPSAEEIGAEAEAFLAEQVQMPTDEGIVLPGAWRTGPSRPGWGDATADTPEPTAPEPRGEEPPTAETPTAEPPAAQPRDEHPPAAEPPTDEAPRSEYPQGPAAEREEPRKRRWPWQR